MSNNSLIETENIPHVEDPSFDSLVEHRQEIKAKIKAYEEECAKIDVKLGNTLDELGLKTVVWRTEYDVIRTKGTEPRATIDRIMLLENGVSADVIAKSTRYGEPGKPSIRVQPKNRKATSEPAN